MRIRIPDLTRVLFEGGSRDFSGDSFSDKDMACGLRLTGDRLDVRLLSRNTPVRFIRLRWQFSPEERRGEPVRIYGDAWERAGGNLEWRGIVPERCMPWFALVSSGTDVYGDRNGRFTEGFGVMTRPAAMCFWQYDAAGITLWLDVRSGGDGVILSGRELAVASVVFGEYRNLTAFEAGRRFAKRMCPAPLLPAHAVYGANNWYYAYGESSRADILSDARALRQMCEGLSNRPYMVIDDGWTKHPKNGPWNEGNARFGDMASLAREIHAQDARAGIWVRYMADEDGACALPEHWHLRNAPNYLDPSLPEVLSYVRDTTRTLVEWGYDLIKYDCSAQDILGRRGYKVPYVVSQDGWHFRDRSRTSAEVLIGFYDAVKSAAGEDTVLLGCATYTHLCAGAVHIARTGADINGKSWDITRRMGVNALAFRMMLHGAFFAVDADCVGITDKIPWERVKDWLKLLSASGTPLFVSCKSDFQSDEMRRLIAQAYRLNAAQADALIPLDWMENICPGKWLLNGQELTVNWYDASEPALFAGKSD